MPPLMTTIFSMGMTAEFRFLAKAQFTYGFSTPLPRTISRGQAETIRRIGHDGRRAISRYLLISRSERARAADYDALHYDAIVMPA